MFERDRRLVCISLALLTPMVAGAEPLDRFLRPGLSLTLIQAKSPQPAGRPILITLAFTNSTEKPISLGPYPYLSLDGVDVRIMDAQGMEREAALENSSHGPWSGGLRQLSPGQSEEAPAIVPPLKLYTAGQRQEGEGERQGRSAAVERARKGFAGEASSQ
jgi:hypothetical protein